MHATIDRYLFLGVEILSTNTVEVATPAAEITDDPPETVLTAVSPKLLVTGNKSADLRVAFTLKAGPQREFTCKFFTYK